MNNSLRIIINAVLGVAVAVLFFLHFSSRSAANAPQPAAVVTAPPANSDSAAMTATTPEIPTPTETPATEPAPTTPATAVAPPGPTSATEGKIAYVESGKLLDGYQGMKDARKAFEVKAKGWERQNQMLLTGFKTAVEQYQKSANGLSAEQRAATERKLGAQQQQVAQQQQQLQQQAQEEEAKLTSTVLGRINKQVEAYGKARGYKLILIAAPSGTIAYGQKDLDITAPVLTYLNGEYRKK